MNTQRFSRNKPTKSGYYWCRARPRGRIWYDYRDDPELMPTVEYIDPKKDKDKIDGSYFGWDGPSMVREFSGPIPIPEGDE